MAAFNRFIEKWMALVTPICLLLGVWFPDMIGTLFQQVLAAFYGKATEQPGDNSKN